MSIRFRKQQGDSRLGKQATQASLSWLVRLLVLIIIFYIIALPSGLTPTGRATAQSIGRVVFLPAVTAGLLPRNTPLIHIPFFNVNDVYTTRYYEMAVFWFGKVSLNDNYTHVRMGYNSQQISMEISTYDRQLWYDDQSPTAAEVANWDAVSIYFQVPANGQHNSRLLRFDAQLSAWETRPAYQAAFEKTTTGWRRVNIPFITGSIYRGDNINVTTDGKGWMANYEIPFASLGLSGKPADQSELKMGIRVHDRDGGPNGPTSSKDWPTGFLDSNPDTYGLITFGYPITVTPPLKPAGSVTVKQGVGMNVMDGSVGGWATCGGSLNYWTEWGEKVYDGPGVESEQVVIQNQKDVADFPCFSRYYISFPLGTMPRGKVILSAKLIMHQFGNSMPSDAWSSYIQVFRVREAWKEETLSWNNSPQVYENYPGSWVGVLPNDYPTDPGEAYTWDVTQALRTSIGEKDNELRLALQSADSAMHSGKYFWSSETASSSSERPPRLVVEWANP